MPDRLLVRELGHVTDRNGIAIHIVVYCGQPTCWTCGNIQDLEPDQQTRLATLWDQASREAAEDLTTLGGPPMDP